MDLALDAVAPGRYALGDVGTLDALPRYAAQITAGGTSWRCKRAAMGFGQIINAVEVAGGERAGRYVPNGFLHLRGIYAGSLLVGERAWTWRANRQLGRHFTLSDGAETLAEFDAGSVQQPVRAHLADLSRVDPLVLLFCCHIVKQAVDTASIGAKVAVGTATAR
jgi:hypothetical protein